MQDDLVTTKQAAQRLGWTVDQFHKRIKRTDLAPAFQLEGLRGTKFWRVADIDSLQSSPAATPAA